MTKEKDYKKKAEDKKTKEKVEKAPPCCEGCVKWKLFGKKCFVYWDGKKYCTQKVAALSEEE